MIGNSIILVLLLICIKIFYSEFFYSTKIKAVDGNKYMVLSQYHDKDKAAELISEINIFTLKLIKELKSSYITNPDIESKDYIQGRIMTERLIHRYSSKSLRENEPVSPLQTSYTMNKGEIIALCLREKKSGMNRFHSINELKFVLLHELAHIITVEMDHSPLFWKNFKFLLEFCEKNDLYKSSNYEKNNKVYCGLNIEYNPIFDVNVKSYF